MALECRTTLIIGPSKDQNITFVSVGRNERDEKTFRIDNMDSSFSRGVWPLSEDWKGCNPPQWFHYILAGITHIKKHFGLEFLTGMNVLVSGRVVHFVNVVVSG